MMMTSKSRMLWRAMSMPSPRPRVSKIIKDKGQTVDFSGMKFNKAGTYTFTLTEAHDADDDRRGRRAELRLDDGRLDLYRHGKGRG